MKHEKKLIVLNTLVPIILFIILLFLNISENFINIMTLTLFIGWALPYLTLILTGLSILNKSHRKLALTINIINSLLTLVLIILVLCIIDKLLIGILIEYIIIMIITIINIISLSKYLKENPDPELEEISRTKKANNGIIK